MTCHAVNTEQAPLFDALNSEHPSYLRANLLGSQWGSKRQKTSEVRQCCGGFWQWEAYGRSHDLKSLRMTRNFWGTLLWLVAGIAGMIFTCFQKTSHTQPQRIAMLQDVAGQLPKIGADLTIAYMTYVKTHETRPRACQLFTSRTIR